MDIHKLAGGFKKSQKPDGKLKQQGIAKALQKTIGRVQGSGIRTRLYAALAIPLLFMAVFGLAAYRWTSDAIITNYEISTTETLSATRDYISMGIEAVSQDAYEIINSDVVKQYYNKADQLGPEESSALFLEIADQLTTVKAASDYIYNIHIFGSKGSGISTAGELPENFYESFLATEEGRKISGSPERFLWTGRHDFLDETLGNGRTAYSLSIIRKLSENNGFIVIDIPEGIITKSISKLQLGEAYITGFVAPDGKETLINTDETNVFTQLEAYSDMTVNREQAGFSIQKYKGESYVFLYSKASGTGAALCMLVPEDTILEKADAIKVLIIVFVLLACILAAVLGGIISGGIAKEITKITKVIGKASKGDLTIEFNTKRKDEFRILSAGLTEMVSGMRNLIEKVSQVGMKVSNSANELSLTSSAILSSTQNISQAIEEIGGGIIQQASDSEQCSNLMSDLSDKINHVYHNSYEIEQIARSTKAIIGDGIVTVNELSDKSGATTEITHLVIREIEELEQQSRSIEKVIGVINDIAAQTNLLSLNASIEAARAGEAGRGFSVVAEEVRKLADQSVAAANQIKDIIREIQIKTENTVISAKQARGIVESQTEALLGTVKAFENINVHVGSLVNNLDHISEGVNGIESAKDETMDAIRSISAVSQQTASASEEVSATAIRQTGSVEHLSKEAAELAEEAAKLENAIQQFIIA